MRIKGLVDEDFVNYKLPCMFIATCFCDWKCCKEVGLPIETCQNCEISTQPIINISEENIFQRYITNPISKSLVIAGLEPLVQQYEVYKLIKYFRNNGCEDDIVIYTGYDKVEVQDFVQKLQISFKNIYIKFGRYIPNQLPHYDEVLKIKLASDNQYGEQIS